MSDPQAPPKRDETPATRARTGRNRVIGLLLAAFVLLIFLVTLARLGANILDRPL